jgi:acyl-coenzyme A thioesterase PaaI-like protein
VTAHDAAVLGPHVDGPDADGFYGITFHGDGHNAGYGRIVARAEGESVARVRFETGRRAANVVGAVHGGFMLSCLDQALFLGPIRMGRLESAGRAVTLGLSTQFLAPGRLDIPLDCVIEMVGETGKLIFLRGQVEQEGRALLTWQATLRKIAPRAA